MMRDERIAREVLATIKENAAHLEIDPALCDYDAMQPQQRATLLAAVRVGLVFIGAANADLEQRLERLKRDQQNAEMSAALSRNGQ